jgi:hypothetical protein
MNVKLIGKGEEEVVVYLEQESSIHGPHAALRTFLCSPKQILNFECKKLNSNK